MVLRQVNLSITGQVGSDKTSANESVNCSGRESLSRTEVTGTISKRDDDVIAVRAIRHCDVEITVTIKISSDNIGTVEFTRGDDCSGGKDRECSALILKHQDPV